MEEKSIPPVLEVEYPLMLNHIGPDAELRPHIAFDYMQDIAARHADLLGVGMTSLHELNIIWVLSRIKLHMDRYPSADDTVLLRTWPRGFRKLFATRQYELISRKNGVRLGYASSWWLMLDAASLRPVNPAKVITGLLPANEDREVFYDDLPKIPECSGGNPLVVTVDQSHVDYNDHMNNAFYAMFTQDYLARKQGRRIRWQEIQLNFNHSVRFGESFTCSGEIQEDGSFLCSGTLPDGRNVYTAVGKLV